MTTNNQQQQLLALKNKLNELHSIDTNRYQEIINILNKVEHSDAYTAQGKLKLAMFSSKKYDIEAFEKQLPDNIEIESHTSELNENTAILSAGAKVVCVFVNDICNAQVVECLAKQGVELIALRCAGFNNVDLDACKKFNLDVVRVPAYSPHAIAEHCIALMLMLNRQLHKAYLRNRNGQFILDGLVGFNMHNKSVGVIGTGKIGCCVIDILIGFGCKVLAYDKIENARLKDVTNVKYVTLPALLENADIVTLHAPLIEDTHHCINADAINKMKKGAMLINTSRGGLVDSQALVNGLKSGQIGAAGLDVYEEEAGIFFNDLSEGVLNDDVLARLMTFNNVIITSHQAFLTHEALANIAQTTLFNIKQYMSGKRGKQLENLVR